MDARTHDISLRVNGEDVFARVEARKTLVDFLREDLSLTGSHIGCEHGVCGACTVRLDGEVVRGCLVIRRSSMRSKLWRRSETKRAS
jgi:carbon-monoxide dehydrogenase small subunit